ncbi:adenosine deaminase [Granulicoccus phenolivorans]|uniref:adenosine deaminase n=1 Tax=Granulicoccus phenolivorans TaxID=266854 RepID=UPI0004298408|nr:adenosine deaminase [Granulicoccus phenolivorans]
MTDALTPDLIRRAPKVALHDHLDGGLRPATILELAEAAGHQLPAADPEALGTWFFEAADSGTLARYLETFDHTIAVMQSADALRRVAREWVLDQAADGVVYAEARWAPEQHQRAGLTLEAAVEAVRDGLAEGVAEAATQGQSIIAAQLVTAMRQSDRWLEIARLATAYRHDSVCGFDIAGPEIGFPPDRHPEAYEWLRAHNMRYTLHAGEAEGLGSIQAAIGRCGAYRLGHGVRILDDVRREGDGWILGDLAALVRDTQIPLEVCPSSNLQTGIAASYAEHPFGDLYDLGFNVTVSCDNRLMSRTTLTREFSELAAAFGYDLDDLETFTVNAADAAFLGFEEKQELIAEVFDGFAALRES